MNNIIYRVSPFRQHNTPPIYSDDKWKLVQLAHKTFLKTLNEDVSILYLLDRCPEWTDYFLNNYKYASVINYVAGDRSGSIKEMFNQAKYMPGKIFFCEDDYLWKPNKIKNLFEALDTFKLVSPYNHPAHFIEPKFKDFNFEYKKIGKITWRNSPSNTHTFGTTHEYLKNNWEIFINGMWDAPMFEQLPDKVWNPVPSFATHLCADWMADGDWSFELKTSID